MREKLARAIHEAYRLEQAERLDSSDPSMQEWGSLSETLKESNRQQAEDIGNKLSSLGYRMAEAVPGESAAIIIFDVGEVEKLAEMEHERWNNERLRAGWTLGEKKDVERKVTPYLVPWSELPDDVKEWDRQTVRKIPEFLARVAISISPADGDASKPRS